MKSAKCLAFAVLLAGLLTRTAFPQQSTTGPVPPPGIDRGLQKVDPSAQVIIPGVPAYLWQHGCGPTALGMVVGYWDGHGFPNLVPGDATTQTPAVNAMIANDNGNPTCGFPFLDHYQDYSCPIDNSPGPLLSDRSQTGGAHADNCVADFMHTSWSAFWNYYGWSWFSDVAQSFIGYVNFVSGNSPNAENIPLPTFTWEAYKAEIDNGRPVVLLVDTDGDGQTDHFITGIGYNDVTMQYGVHDTWDQKDWIFSRGIAIRYS